MGRIRIIETLKVRINARNFNPRLVASDLGMLKVYFIGLLILVSAIILNVISGKIGLTGWYDFLNGLAGSGRKIFDSLNFMDYVWLFVLYPFLLGCSVFFAEKLFRLFSL
ncbi:MAG: DUF7672 family protein [Cyclobacteriaceae bacterium]